MPRDVECLNSWLSTGGVLLIQGYCVFPALSTQPPYWGGVGGGWESTEIVVPGIISGFWNFLP